MMNIKISRFPALGLAVMAVLAALSAQLSTVRAQGGTAPDSLAGSMLTLAVGSGQAPFAAAGDYRIFISVAGTNYCVLGRSGPLASGACTYAATGLNTGGATLVDAGSGPGTTLQLAFGSPTNGTFTLAKAAGSQTGSFTLSRCADLAPPQLFLPGMAGGQFQSHLGGQPGFIYAIETSSNLVHWQRWQDLPLAELTGDISDPNGQKARFYRARLGSTAFAPADLTNKTFNLTIGDGKPPLATNGICQWEANANDPGYQIIGGPGTATSSGTYAYTRTGPDSGVIICQDSLEGTLTEQLFFTSPQSGYFFTTNAAGYEAGTFTMAEGPVEFLGNVKFTSDTARAGTLIFVADGLPARLSVTNAAGWVWTLDFPGDALAGPQIITMAPFATVNSSQALLPLTNGVSLAPDGLQFDNGVTLTVTPPGSLTANAALMMADGTGGNLCFIGGTNESGALATTLFHFSSVGAVNPSDAQWSVFFADQLDRAQRAYAQATNDVQALLKNAANLPPPPPDYVWDCSGTTNADAQAKIDKYTRTVFAKEDDAIGRLISAAWELKSLGSDHTTNATKLARKLIQTAEFGQVTNLFVRYYTLYTNEEANVDGDSYKFMALYRLSSHVNEESVLYGGKASSLWASLCKNWSKSVRDGFVLDVHDRHLYSKAQVAMNVETFRNTVMNITPDLKGSFQSKLAKALTFKLSVNIKADVSAPGGSMHVTTEFKGDEIFSSSSLTFAATTNFDYVSGSWVGSGSSGTCTYLQDPKQSRPIDAWMYLNLCGASQTVTFCIPMWLARTTTWTGCQETPEHMSQQPYDWDQPTYNMVLLATPNNPALNGFTRPLADGQTQIVNETIQLQGNYGTVYTMAFQFLLQHKPR
jgi:hypothetical protein